MRGDRRENFKYVDKGTMATIGRSKAIADIQGWKFSGFIAWLMWLFLHVFFLIGFRNRIYVLLEWFWAYLTRERSARLITGDARELRNAIGFIRGDGFEIDNPAAGTASKTSKNTAAANAEK